MLKGWGWGKYFALLPPSVYMEIFLSSKNMAVSVPFFSVEKMYKIEYLFLLFGGAVLTSWNE